MNSLSIIIPCYNPLQNWEEKLFNYFSDLKNNLENVNVGLILVNDGSNRNIEDKHIQYLKNHIPGLKYISYPKNQGKGHALRKGVESSDSRVNILTDIDFPYTTGSIVAIYREIGNGSDVAWGHREIEYYAKVPFLRKILSRLFRFFLSILLKLPITDTQCGLKGFNQKGRALFLKTKINRFLFDLEFVIAVAKTKTLKLSPVPVELRQGVRFSTMNPRILIIELFNLMRIIYQIRKYAPNI